MRIRQVTVGISMDVSVIKHRVWFAATASMAIHQAEMAEIVRKVLSEHSINEEGTVVSLPA